MKFARTVLLAEVLGMGILSLRDSHCQTILPSLISRYGYREYLLMNYPTASGRGINAMIEYLKGWGIIPKAVK
ncbi:MAG: hypothetical protein HOC24_09840 [Deltaproteobacteria bacterium]|jgi:hypothetical protein|nr:hypothetical protein [Deltaproteobacteria bacterium]